MAKTKQVSQYIRNQKPYPLFGKDYKESDFTNTSLIACEEYDLSTNKGIDKCIQQQIKAANAKIGFGGYLERRTIYQRSERFQKKEEARNIHLGIDFWGMSGIPIYAPIAGKVHSWAYNNLPDDYGATIILEHAINGIQFHTLYGHLSRADLNGLDYGKKLSKGQMFCHIGSEQENGGWVPHLHFQIILDMQEMRGDYPGVAAPSEIEYYKENCPNPELLFTTE